MTDTLASVFVTVVMVGMLAWAIWPRLKEVFTAKDKKPNE